MKYDKRRVPAKINKGKQRVNYLNVSIDDATGTKRYIKNDLDLQETGRCGETIMYVLKGKGR